MRTVGLSVRCLRYAQRSTHDHITSPTPQPHPNPPSSFFFALLLRATFMEYAPAVQKMRTDPLLSPPTLPLGRDGIFCRYALPPLPSPLLPAGYVFQGPEMKKQSRSNQPQSTSQRRRTGPPFTREAGAEGAR